MSDPFTRVAEALNNDIQGDVQNGGSFWVLNDDEFLVTKEPTNEGGVYTVYTLYSGDVAQKQTNQELKTQDVGEAVEYLQNGGE